MVYTGRLPVNITLADVLEAKANQAAIYRCDTDRADKNGDLLSGVIIFSCSYTRRTESTRRGGQTP